MTTKTKHVLSALFFAGFFTLAIASTDDKKTETEISTNAPTTSISATRLSKEYADNEVAADLKYKNNALLVSGIVGEITKDFTDKIIVILSGDEMSMGVYCSFSDNHINETAQLKKGQKITVKGKCGGSVVGAVSLSGCSIQ